MHDRTRDRRRRHWFWMDDRVVDEFGPIMARYPFGTAALAIYAVLARRADREGESWPSLRSIAEESGASTSTVKRALRLLEVLGLVEIAICYEQGSKRQTSHLYTLLTPPERPPELDPDPKNWPAPKRRTLLVRGANRSGTPPSGGDSPPGREGPGGGTGLGGEAVAAARVEQRTVPSLAPRGVQSVWAGIVPVSEQTPGQPGPLPPATVNAPPAQVERLPPSSLTPQEGNTEEGNPKKEGSTASFVIAEVGLTNRQVWAATLAELERRGVVGRVEIDTWLRPAALVGRDGKTLIVGAPNAVARDRIARRLLPAVRAAVSLTVGGDVAVSVVVEKGQSG